MENKHYAKTFYCIVSDLLEVNWYNLFYCCCKIIFKKTGLIRCLPVGKKQAKLDRQTKWVRTHVKTKINSFS